MTGAYKQYSFTGKAIRAMSSDELDDNMREISQKLTVKQRKFVEARMAGSSAADSMELAGYAKKCARVNAHQHFTICGKNARTIMDLYHEKASREVVSTAVDVRRRMWDVFHATFEDRDWSSTLRALEAISKLDGLNAIEQLKLVVDVTPEREVITDAEWEVLSVMTHSHDPKVIEHDPTSQPPTAH